MIKLKGDYLEGGGQIVRTALTLSVLTGKRFEVKNIRKNRPNPGLKEQHMQSINALSELFETEHNAFKNAKQFYFKPGKFKNKKKIEVNIETAGSTALLLSVLLPLSLKLEKELQIEVKGGGTWNKWAPSVLYLKEILIEKLKKYGFSGEIKIKKNGFYPWGGALTLCEIKPWKERKEINETKKEIKKLDVYSFATINLESRKVAKRQMASALDVLEELDLKKNTKVEYKGEDYGSGILIKSYPTIIGVDNLGEKGKKAELVGKEAAERFLSEYKSDAAVDKYAADQLMVYLAFLGGKYKTSEITKHAKTNAYVIEQFLPVKFSFDDGIIETEKAD